MNCDLYTETTVRIVAALERGVTPWVCPWSAGADGMPVNATTGRPYRGINVVLLTMEAQAHSYTLNRWLTYRQAAAVGGQVREGAHGTAVVFWKLHHAAAEASPSHDDTVPRVIPLLRCYTVFNTAQIDGLPPAMTRPAAAAQGWSGVDAAEAVLDASDADIRHGGSRAFYHAGQDYVQLPARTSFATAAGYYATALHELVHWTGHPARLDRQLSGRFGEDAYAAEELVAELGAAFLCAHCRLDGQLQHASYIGSWLRVLRSDKRAIFVASTKAQHAADFLLERSTDKSDASVLSAA